MYTYSYKKRRRLKIKPIITLIVIIILIIGGIKLINTIKYHKTYEYKLLQINYNIDEVKKIETLSDSNIDKILLIPYNRNIVKLLNEKYFLEKHLWDYLDYMENNDKKISDVVAIINTHTDNEWYEYDIKADSSLNEKMLVNKFYHLDNTYNSENMVKISNVYSYGTGQMLTKETWDAFLNMWNKAMDDGYKLIINSSYRSYEDQDEIYNYYKDTLGEAKADKRAAHPGYSEHQTGMAMDLINGKNTGQDFDTSEEFKWLENNAYKYGFILRYPKGKEYLTGYDYESWHYRYVGVEIATYIHENNITYDEYYAYFIEGNNNEKEKKN